MFFQVLILLACIFAAQQAYYGTNSPSAKIAMFGLILSTVTLVIF